MIKDAISTALKEVNQNTVKPIVDASLAVETARQKAQELGTKVADMANAAEQAATQAKQTATKAEQTAIDAEVIIKRLKAENEETANYLGNIKGLQEAINSQKDIVASVADRLKNDNAFTGKFVGVEQLSVELGRFNEIVNAQISQLRRDLEGNASRVDAELSVLKQGMNDKMSISKVYLIKSQLGDWWAAVYSGKGGAGAPITIVPRITVDAPGNSAPVSWTFRKRTNG